MSELRPQVQEMTFQLEPEDYFPNSQGDWLHAAATTRTHPDLASLDNASASPPFTLRELLPGI